jgi:hypothetical protein
MSSSSLRLKLLACFGLALTAWLVGCDDRGETARVSGDASPARTASTASTEAAADPLPTGLVLAEAPAGAKEVLAVRKDAKQGDEVVLRGRVGGSKTPFVAGRASFQLVDASLKACGEGTAMDECKTPWDYCCSEPKEIAAHSASVQVVGADGRPLRAALAGAGGLKPLSEVVVKGTVAKAAESGVLVVNATGIYVKR